MVNSILHSPYTLRALSLALARPSPSYISLALALALALALLLNHTYILQVIFQKLLLVSTLRAKFLTSSQDLKRQMSPIW